VGQRLEHLPHERNQKYATGYFIERAHDEKLFGGDFSHNDFIFAEMFDLPLRDIGNDCFAVI